MMPLQFIYCVVGTGLLVLSVILCIVLDAENAIWWVIVQIIGELIAFFGYAPVLLKFFNE